MTIIVVQHLIYILLHYSCFKRVPWRLSRAHQKKNGKHSPHRNRPIVPLAIVTVFRCASDDKSNENLSLSCVKEISAYGDRQKTLAQDLGQHDRLMMRNLLRDVLPHAKQLVDCH